MYRVYKDPDGKRFLEQDQHHPSANKVTIYNETEEDYKKRIESLNGEIKALNDELEKVAVVY